MKKDGKQKKVNNKSSKRSAIVIIAAILGIGIAIYSLFVNDSTVSAAKAIDTIALNKTEISNTISISGQVDSSSVVNIYSSLSNYPVKEVLANIGDSVKKGDILAKIDTTDLEYDINQAKNNLESAIKSLETEKQNNQNSIINAENSLNSAIVSRDKQQLAYEKSLKTLKEAEEAIEKPFDSYTYDNIVSVAKLTLERNQKDLLDAEADLIEATENFDDYSYQNLITESKVTLDRKKADLKEAEEKVKTEINAFDTYTYQNAIDAARIDLERKKTDLKTAESNYSYSSQEIIAAKRAVDDAQKEYDNTVKDLERAKDKAVEDARKNVSTIKSAVSDAQRAYDNAIIDLERAKKDAIETAAKKLETVQKAVEDAQIALDKAITDLQRAKDKAIEDNNKQLETAKQDVSDSMKSLEASKLSVTNAQNSLNQAKSNNLSNESNVENQQIALDKLLDQLSRTEIIASESGTITTINIKEGTNPNGILFTIEDTNLLYVSAKVKEYNLKDLSIGQSVFITSDATDKEIFESEIIYISPKAVSEAGSTSVEFEIWAAIKNPSENIKIGMNAYLEIVINSKKDVYTVPLTAIITNENGSFIRTQSGEELIDIAVEIGIKTSTSAEISGKGIIDGLLIVKDQSTSPAPKQSLLSGIGI